MSEYTQLVAPDMSIRGTVGLCLSFQEDVYHTPHSYLYALQAWRATQYKHLDQDFPEGVSVLLWWDYYEDDIDAGHVATRLPNGTLYSSPYKVGTPQAILLSIEGLECTYSDNGVHPLKYLGWSEDIAGVRIIGEVMDTYTADELQQSYRLLGNVVASQTEINNYMKSGKSYKQITEELKAFFDKNHTSYPWYAQNAQVSTDTIVLKPGKYQVN